MQCWYWINKHQSGEMLAANRMAMLVHDSQNIYLSPGIMHKIMPGHYSLTPMVSNYRTARKLSRDQFYLSNYLYTGNLSGLRWAARQVAILVESILLWPISSNLLVIIACSDFKQCPFNEQYFHKRKILSNKTLATCCSVRDSTLITL